MAKMLNRNWKVKPGVHFANKGFPAPLGRAAEKENWRVQELSNYERTEDSEDS